MLALNQQLKILLLQLRQAPGGELAGGALPKPVSSTKPGPKVDPLAQLDIDLLLKVAHHLQRSQSVETGGLPQRDFIRLQWWSQDYCQQLTNTTFLVPTQTSAFDPAKLGPNPAQVQTNLDSELESSEIGAVNPTPPVPKAAATSPASSAHQPDHPINKIYHRQKLTMLVPLALKLRQTRSGELAVKNLDAG